MDDIWTTYIVYYVYVTNIAAVNFDRQLSDTHPSLDSGALLYHGAVFQLNFGHLNIGNLDFIPAWIMVQSRPNLREESFLSTFGEVMLLHLMSLLQFCQSCLHRFWSCGTTQQVVGDVGVIASKNICGPVKAVIR